MLARFKLEKQKGQEDRGKSFKSKIRPKHFGETSHSRLANDSLKRDISKNSRIRRSSKKKDNNKAKMIDKKKVIKEKWQSTRKLSKTLCKTSEKSKSSETGQMEKAQEKKHYSPQVNKPIKSSIILPETTLNLSDRPIRAAAATAQVWLEQYLNTDFKTYFLTRPYLRRSRNSWKLSLLQSTRETSMVR